MRPRSVEWRRILTAEPKDESRTATSDVALKEILVPSAASGMGAVLQSYEHLYLENERLREECVQLRRQLLRGQGRPSTVRPDGSSARAAEAVRLVEQLRDAVHGLQQGLRTLESEVAKLRNGHGPAQDGVVERASEAQSRSTSVATQPATLPQKEEVDLDTVAKLVAEWMFPRPNSAQIRLVHDALRNKKAPDVRS